MFGLIILVVTLLAAGGAAYLALKLPPDYIQQWKLLTGGILVGLLFGTIFYWQQMRATTRAIQERDAAIEDVSNRVVPETTQRVTDEVSKRYEQQIKSLTKQVGDLESQLPNQGMALNVAGDKNAPAANTGAASTAARQADGTPNIFWIQSNQDVGKGAAEVQFRIYGALNVPAFVAICDHPCRAVGGQAGTGSEGIPLIGATDRDVAAFIFRKPRPMPAGTEGAVRIQSSDRGPVQVTAFRILRESEVPADLR